MNGKKQPEQLQKEEIRRMFDAISHHYDRLNHILSLGTDRRWRSLAIRLMMDHVSPSKVLDVATGTADLAIAATRLNPEKIIGIDLSERMLLIGRKKIARLGLADRIELLHGDSEKIMFPDATFDAVMSAFGVRNFADLKTGLGEMFRVLKPGGMILILEFSKPSGFPLRQIYGYYFRKILPCIGRKVSGDREAYSYLVESVMSFPDNENFLRILSDAGFSDVSQARLSGGIVSVYYGFRY